MSSGRHILVIDDDPDFCDYVRIVLTFNQFTVDTACSPQEGLARMHTRLPDLVIVDFMMSHVLDGVAVSRAMRCDAALCAIPILLVSAVVSDRDDHLLTKEEKARVTAFLSKPIGPAQLVACVQRLLQPSDDEEV